MSSSSERFTGSPSPSLPPVRSVGRSHGKQCRVGLLGPDIFISYSRADSTRYALSLANALSERSYSPYVDQLSTEPGAIGSSPVWRALERSRMLVVIASEGSCNSGGVAEEVEKFPKHPNRPIVPVNIEGALASASWAAHIVGLPAELESRRNLLSAEPDAAVLQRIVSSFTYTRRAVRLKRLTVTVLSIVLALSGAAIVLTMNVDRLRSEVGRLVGDKLSLEGSVRQLSGDRNSLQGQNGELIHERTVLNAEISKTRVELDQSNIAAARAARDAAWRPRHRSTKRRPDGPLRRPGR